MTKLERFISLYDIKQSLIEIAAQAKEIIADNPQELYVDAVDYIRGDVEHAAEKVFEAHGIDFETADNIYELYTLGKEDEALLMLNAAYDAE